MKKTRVLISDIYDPWFNLATEDWIFRDLDPEQRILFLWRNQPTVVIGRSQNPWLECHLEKMEKDQILLARRQSGGGAVFHDLGNTNFTFLASKKNYNKSDNFNIIIAALKQFGIKAQLSGRNDIVVNSSASSKKISGNAFRHGVDRAFHHGTLLINTDLNQLQNYLNPNKKKLESKGITSVKSRVTNLQELNPEINHDVLSWALIQEFFEFHAEQGEIEYLNHDTLAKQPKLHQHYEKLKDWGWRFGQTFEFTHQLEERFSWASIDLRLNVKHGVIENTEIYSDCLYPELIDAFKKILIDVRYQTEDVLEAMKQLASAMPDHEAEITEFQGWLQGEVI